MDNAASATEAKKSAPLVTKIALGVCIISYVLFHTQLCTRKYTGLPRNRA